MKPFAGFMSGKSGAKLSRNLRLIKRTELTSGPKGNDIMDVAEVSSGMWLQFSDSLHASVDLVP